MRRLGETSGRWNGYWQYRSYRGRMNLTLTLTDRVFEGEGVDEYGAFVIVGVYSVAGYSVEFIKSYVTHEVIYSGTWDGQKMQGTWRLQEVSYSPQNLLKGYCGAFELWPAYEAQQ